MDHVVIGYIHSDMVRAEFMRSMLLTKTFAETPIDAILSLRTGPLIANGRNRIVDMFLTEQKASWLLMVDTDMVFKENAMDRLVQAAEYESLPMLGGLCYAETDEGPLPTMYELVVEEDGPCFARYNVWPENKTFPVAATGAAFLLVHRDAFTEMQEKCNDKHWPWFRESVLAGKKRIGEDLTFCMRAQSIGIPVHVHTGVQVGHMKSTMLGEVT